MSFAAQVKNSLLHIISSMVSHPEDFFMHPRTDFSRNRKLDFSTLLQLIISMEAGTLGRVDLFNIEKLMEEIIYLKTI